jgi:hypothetical protein
MAPPASQPPPAAGRARSTTSASLPRAHGRTLAVVPRAPPPCFSLCAACAWPGSPLAPAAACGRPSASSMATTAIGSPQPARASVEAIGDFAAHAAVRAACEKMGVPWRLRPHYLQAVFRARRRIEGTPVTRTARIAPHAPLRGQRPKRGPARAIDWLPLRPRLRRPRRVSRRHRPLPSRPRCRPRSRARQARSAPARPCRPPPGR